MHDRSVLHVPATQIAVGAGPHGGPGGHGVLYELHRFAASVWYWESARAAIAAISQAPQQTSTGVPTAITTQSVSTIHLWS